MGPLGWPETVFLFFLALILFGPKKLPNWVAPWEKR